MGACASSPWVRCIRQVGPYVPRPKRVAICWPRSHLTPASAQLTQSWLAHRCLQYPFVARTNERVHVGSLDFRGGVRVRREPGDEPALQVRTNKQTRTIMRQAPCQPSWPIWIGLRKDAPPKRGLKAMHGERGAFPRAPRPAGFGFVMVPYRSLPLGPRSGDLRSITPLSQERAYQQQPISEVP
jgi:hypothetical protein